MNESRLFTILPDYVCTPDSMEIDRRNGDLIVSCPNFADDSFRGCVIRIDKNKNITKWFDVPVEETTGLARNMGIAFDDDYNIYLCDNIPWLGRKELDFKGRVLKITADENGIVDWHVVAYGMEHPNGVKIRGNYMYVTQSYLTKIPGPGGHLVSGVYRFALDDENIEVKNNMEDPNLFTTIVTENERCQYGADGIVFGADGALYVGNYGDGVVHRITFAPDGSCASNDRWAGDYDLMKSTDGMILDEKTGDIYIADFNDNAVCRVTKEGKVSRIASSPDCTGLEGGLDQPCDVCIWEGKIIASCFDLVTDETKVNTAHEMPATMAEVDIPF